MAAFLVFVLEMALFVWPIGWLKEDMSNYLTGEGSWEMERQKESFSCRQKFRPAGNNLTSIGIVLSGAEELHGGNAILAISDTGNKVLFETSIPYESMEIDAYTQIPIEPPLNQAGRSCYLNVYLESDENGNIPVLKAASTDFHMPENISLEQEEKLEDAQLVTRYNYKDIVSVKKGFRAFLICFITALGIAFGIPDNKRFREFLGIVLLAAIPWVLGRRLELLTINNTLMLPFSMKWNIALMYLFELILLFCTRSFRASICFSSLTLTLLYSANYFVYSFRGEPLRLNDFAAIGTAAKVVSHYDLSPNSHLAMAWCIFIFFLAYGAQTGFRSNIQKKSIKAVVHLASLSMGLALAVVAGHRLLYTDMLVNAGFMHTRGFAQRLDYYYNGYLVASCMDIQDSRIEKPQGYSLQKVSEFLKDAAETKTTSGEGIQPHVILVMNESFSDLRVLGNLQISEENLTFFNGLKDNTVRGYVNASVLGGGTANSEFEVFTGSSMGFLPPSYYPYQQCMVSEMPSMISDMKKAGYTTYSMHPEVAGNWNRGRIYPYFGFDHSLWIEDFEDSEKIHFGVTDLETYKKVEELFENRQPGEKMFIFNLTIQNHGDYSQSDVPLSVRSLNVSSMEADIYLSLIRNSDEAFRQLVTYFENEEEPVIICMFGDHQPCLADSFYESVYSQTQGMEEKDKTMNMYKTPFLIWANYDIPEQEDLNIGMNYLGALLLDTAGIQGSPYFAFLQEHMKEYPVITVNGYEDKDGNYYAWSEDNSEFPEYRMLQYNHIFDKNIVEWGF